MTTLMNKFVLVALLVVSQIPLYGCAAAAGGVAGAAIEHQIDRKHEKDGK